MNNGRRRTTGDAERRPQTRRSETASHARKLTTTMSCTSTKCPGTTQATGREWPHGLVHHTRYQ